MTRDGTEPSFLAGEQTMLASWLEFHRATLLLTCDGVDSAGSAVRPLEPEAVPRGFGAGLCAQRRAV
jgi:hypothetical protein